MYKSLLQITYYLLSFCLNTSVTKKRKKTKNIMQRMPATSPPSPVRFITLHHNLFPLRRYVISESPLVCAESEREREKEREREGKIRIKSKWLNGGGEGRGRGVAAKSRAQLRKKNFLTLWTTRLPIFIKMKNS